MKANTCTDTLTLSIQRQVPCSKKLLVGGLNSEPVYKALTRLLNELTNILKAVLLFGESKTTLEPNTTHLTW